MRLKRFSAEYTANYGGSRDFAVARAFLRDRGWARACSALLAELAEAIRGASGRD